MQANKQLVVKTLRLMAIYSLALMVVLAIVRTAFAIMFVPWQTLTDNVGSMPKVLFNALRFDLQVVAYCALLPTLWMLAAPLLPATKRMAEAMRKSFRAYYMVAGGLLALLGIIDLGYYSNFNQHISLTFFDFFDEGPADLVVAIWQDYPIIWIVLLLLVVELLFWGLDRRVARPLIAQENRPGIGKSVGLVVVWLVFLTICLRGSVWRFPLQVEDIVVSPEDRINAIVPNAPYMLKKAMKEKSEAFRMRSTKALLSDYKFASLQEALDVYTDHKVQLSADTLSALERALYAEAPRTNSGHQKPNVVVLCCESWSNFLLNFDTPEADLLCGMGKHLKEDICFRNFQSVRNATIATIENLTVGTPYPRLFRSRYRTMRLPSSLA